MTQTQVQHTPTPPSGMATVTPDEFFAALRADPRDIMPSHQNPYCCTWETRHREVWGWSSPGWKNPGAPSVYALAQQEPTQ